MSTRSLSPLESRLILRLEWDKQPVVTIKEAMQILDVSNNHARQVLHRLTRDRWLSVITAGKYELFRVERGEYAFVDTNPFFIGSVLVSPYYFTCATAAFFHGLTTRASSVVYLATDHSRLRSLLVREKEYRAIVQPVHKLFGYIEVDAYGSQVNLAEPEKTILDCLDRPMYAGDIPEVAGMLLRGKSILDYQKVVDYAVRFQSRVLLQRLGYLLDHLKIPVDVALRSQLVAEASGNTKCYLGQPGRWKTGGRYNSAWRVIDNIPPQELMA